MPRNDYPGQASGLDLTLPQLTQIVVTRWQAAKPMPNLHPALCNLLDELELLATSHGSVLDVPQLAAKRDLLREQLDVIMMFTQPKVHRHSEAARHLQISLDDTMAAETRLISALLLCWYALSAIHYLAPGPSSDNP